MENAATSRAQRASLSRALEQEHREIDGVIKGWADGPAPGADQKVGLRRAVDELRRHIYAEEELLFPPLRQAGMVGPILVMLREHGDMWPLLDRLDHGLAEDVDDDVLRSTCRRLLTVLEHHNPKEEQILYPELDRLVGSDASHDVHELLDAGRMPEGWTCQFLRSTHDRGKDATPRRETDQHGDRRAHR